MRHSWRSRQYFRCLPISQSLWKSVLHHGSSNIFSSTQGAENDDLLPIEGHIPSPNSKDGVHDRMTAFCRELDKNMFPEDLTTLTPRSTPQASVSDIELESSSTCFLSDGLPTAEVLEAAVDVFFQRSSLPFIHKPTFDVGTVPDSLLLAMCLLGISSLYPERSRAFVLRYQRVWPFDVLLAKRLLTNLQKMMRFCRGRLASAAPGHVQPWDLLISLATTLLVVYLALNFLVSTRPPAQILAREADQESRRISTNLKLICYARRCCRSVPAYLRSA